MGEAGLGSHRPLWRSESHLARADVCLAARQVAAGKFSGAYSSGHCMRQIKVYFYILKL